MSKADPLQATWAEIYLYIAQQAEVQTFDYIFKTEF